MVDINLYISSNYMYKLNNIKLYKHVIKYKWIKHCSQNPETFGLDLKIRSYYMLSRRDELQIQRHKVVKNKNI